MMNVEMISVESPFCYCACGPYQVLNCIALACREHAFSDLYIFSKFGDAIELSERLRQYNVFHTIHIYDINCIPHIPRIKPKHSFVLFRWLCQIYEMLNYAKIVKSVFDIEKKYKIIFSACFENIEYFGWLYFRKMYGTMMVTYDDGEGSYDCSDFCTPNFGSWKERMARKILFDEKRGMTKKRYLYSPKLFHVLNPDSNFQIEKIPYIWDKPEMQQLAKDIFGVTENELQTNDIVLLDTVHNEVFQDAGEQEIKTIYEKIFENFNKERILIKPHPRDAVVRYEGCKYSQQTSVPFEVLAMEVDMNTKLLIGFGSTSFVNSKIMKDEEPYVLLLYKLIKNRKFFGDKNRSDRYYHAVKEMYRNPEKFMIPETMEELDECLEKLKEIYVK